MKKLILLIAMTLPLMGQAQPPEGAEWWACQAVASAGLNWEDRQWQPARFKPNKRFILVAGDDGVSKASVAKALGMPSGGEIGLICSSDNIANDTFCINNWTGQSFGFRPLTGKGALGGMTGAMMEPEDNGYRDSNYVTPFECVKG